MFYSLLSSSIGLYRFGRMTRFDYLDVVHRIPLPGIKKNGPGLLNEMKALNANHYKEKKIMNLIS